MLMLTELPEMVTVFDERFFQVEIESSVKKKNARKHRYSSFEYCETEPLKKKHIVSRRKENRQNRF